MNKLLKTFLVVASSALFGCQGIPLPQGEGCVAISRPGKAPYNCCFDLAKDFTEDGDPKPEARCKRYPIDTEYINKRINFDPDSYASLKSFALKHKARCEAKQ